ncbi:hypothetical protein BW899_00895 [Bacillus mycoides]|nr:hypothetical protein BW899_00895 [Bacillus mycoides]
MKGKQIKNKTKPFFFDGREARAVDRSGKGFFVASGVRSKVLGSLSFERIGIFLFLLMKNKVSNTLSYFFS